MFHNVKLTVAANGNNLIGYLEGAEADIIGAHNSLFNWGATGRMTAHGDVCDELEFVTHERTRASFYSTPNKIFHYFFNRHLAAIQDEETGGLPLDNPLADLLMRKRAFVLARETYQAMERVPYYRAEVTCDNSGGEFYSMGELRNEKPDDDFKSAAFAGAKSSLDK